MPSQNNENNENTGYPVNPAVGEEVAMFGRPIRRLWQDRPTIQAVDPIAYTPSGYTSFNEVYEEARKHIMYPVEEDIEKASTIKDVKNFIKKTVTKPTKKMEEKIILDKLVYQVNKKHQLLHNSLAKYKTVVPVIDIFFSKRGSFGSMNKVSVTLLWGNSAERESLLNRIADIIKKDNNNIDIIIFASDVWYKTAKKNAGIDRLPVREEDEKRKEGLIVVAFTPDLKYCSSLYEPFKRDIVEDEEVVVFGKKDLIRNDKTAVKNILGKMLLLTRENTKPLKTEAKLPIDNEELMF